MASTPFSRTTRAIYADHFQAVILGLTSVTVLMTGWTLWFFFATIELHEISQTAQISRDGAIIAKFPEASMSRIRFGQSALFFLANQGDEAAAIPATVVNLDPDRGEVQLLPQLDATSYARLQTGGKGRVEVVVDELSPVSLVIRAAGLAPVSEYRKRIDK